MTIEVTVDRFEENTAILKTKDGLKINWPKKNLPKDTKEGSLLYFNISNDKKAREQKENIAKNILNEILKTEE